MIDLLYPEVDLLIYLTLEEKKGKIMSDYYCPECGEELTEDELDKGVCNSCGAFIDEDIDIFDDDELI